MGCAKNEVDSSDMARRLVGAGYSIVEDPEEADAVIVNTCCFIQTATEESIDAILDASSLDSVSSGKAKLIVAGCMPARYGEELAAELPEVSSFVPCSIEDDIVTILDGLFDIVRTGMSAVHGNSLDPDSGKPCAYVKISDGCDRFCSYCAIPYIRGRYHSFKYENICADVKRLVDGGTMEITLIAQDTGRWGSDFDEPSTLADLLDRLASDFPTTWLRVMYIQPEGVTDQLVDVMLSHDNICNYLDIPFQHVNPEILNAMNRKGSASEFTRLIENIRDRIPGCTIRTTFIAGFPGETEEQFEELCDFAQEADLDYAGVFPYSREEGTRAYKLDNQLDDEEKNERAQQLRDICDANGFARMQQHIGKEMDVLVCGVEEDGQLFGRAMCQAPDVDGVTYLPDGEIGSIVHVRIDDSLLYELEATVI